MNLCLWGGIAALLVSATFAKDLRKPNKQNNKRSISSLFYPEFSPASATFNSFGGSGFYGSDLGISLSSYPNYFYSGDLAAPFYSTEVSGHSISHSPANSLIANEGVSSTHEQRLITQHVPVAVPQPYPVTVVQKVAVPTPYVVQVPKLVPYAVPVKVPADAPREAFKVQQQIPDPSQVKPPVEVSKAFTATPTIKAEFPHPTQFPAPHQVTPKFPQYTFGDSSCLGQGGIQGFDSFGSFDFSQGFHPGFGDISGFPSGISGFGEADNIHGIPAIPGGINEIPTLGGIDNLPGIQSSTISSILGEKVDVQADSISVEARSGLNSDKTATTETPAISSKPEETGSTQSATESFESASEKDGIIGEKQQDSEPEENSISSGNADGSDSSNKSELSTSAPVSETTTSASDV